MMAVKMSENGKRYSIETRMGIAVSEASTSRTMIIIIGTCSTEIGRSRKSISVTCRSAGRVEGLPPAVPVVAVAERRVLPGAEPEGEAAEADEEGGVHQEQDDGPNAVLGRGPCQTSRGASGGVAPAPTARTVRSSCLRGAARTGAIAERFDPLALRQGGPTPVGDVDGHNPERKRMDRDARKAGLAQTGRD